MRAIQVWKKGVDGAASIWMQNLKRTADQQDNSLSKKAAIDAGISSLAFDSLSCVQLFGWSMFVALTNQKCALCKRPWNGAVAQIGSYIHQNCR